jgi:hypothetical protein
MTYHYTETAHVLTKDVVNPFAAVVDKRMREGWLNQPVLKAGTRFILGKTDLTRDLQSEHIKPGTYFRVEVRLDRSGSDSDPSCSTGKAFPLSRESLNGDVATVTPDAEYEVQNAETTKERKFAKAKLELQKLLIAELSQPIRDFRSAFLQTKEIGGGNSSAEVLHLLYLAGRISLDEIANLRAQVEANYQA